MAAKPTTKVPTPDELKGAEARKRLRKARQARGMTPEELAALIGRAASTVRAHENGQNKITAEMADAYAAALNTTPAWILWGDGTTEDPTSVPDQKTYPSPRAVEIVGTIDHRVRPVPELPSRAVHIIAPDYDEFPLQAFIVSAHTRKFQQGDYVVSAPVNVGVRDGDIVVTRITNDDGEFYALHELIWSTAGTYLKAVSQNSGDLLMAELPEGVLDRHFPKGTARVEGVIVAYGGQERPTSGRILSPERLAGVFTAR